MTGHVGTPHHLPLNMNMFDVWYFLDQRETLSISSMVTWRKAISIGKRIEGNKSKEETFQVAFVKRSVCAER